MTNWNEIIQQMFKAEKELKCPRCNGTGRVFMSGDLHKSAGMIPCNYENETGICGRNGKWILKKKKSSK